MSDDEYGDEGGIGDGDSQVLIKPEQKLKRPSKYKVVLHNDDYTPMEFVIYVLMSVFRMPYDNAHSTMMKVHTQGSGIAGVYAYEIAETKVAKVQQLSKEHEHPLHCSMEPE